MRKIILLFTLISFAIGNSQILEPVKWTTSVEKISDTEAVLIATANIDSKWHLYSQIVPEGGPIPTVFSFEGNSNYLKKGNTSEETGHTVDDPVFDMRIKFFDTETNFRQRIKLKSKNAFNIKAMVEFMVCDDSRCLPPTEVELLFKIEQH